MNNKLSTWTTEKLAKSKKTLKLMSTVLFCSLLLILFLGIYLALVQGNYRLFGMTGVVAILFIYFKTQLQRIQSELQSRSTN